MLRVPRRLVALVRLVSFALTDRSAQRQAAEEEERAFALFGPGGIFWDPSDELCIEIDELLTQNRKNENRT